MKVLLAGDVTYGLPALRRTLPRVLALVRTGVAYLPSHDPESPARLPAGRPTISPTAA
jgi:hypothetical protein